MNKPTQWREDQPLGAPNWERMTLERYSGLVDDGKLRQITKPEHIRHLPFYKAVAFHETIGGGIKTAF